MTRTDGSPATAVAEFIGDTAFHVHQASQHSLVSGVTAQHDAAI